MHQGKHERTMNHKKKSQDLEASFCFYGQLLLKPQNI